jgi:ribosomal protein S18 acetylase RimI-like enzyme
MIKYTKAKRKDFKLLLDLIFEWQLFETKRNEKANIDEKKLFKQFKQYLKEHYKDKTCTHFICKRNKEYIGYIFVGYDEVYKDEGNIYELFVIEKERRNGIATELVKIGTEWLKKKNASKIILGVHSSNKIAIKFYKKFNFLKVKEDYISLEKNI